MKTEKSQKKKNLENFKIFTLFKKEKKKKFLKKYTDNCKNQQNLCTINIVLSNNIEYSEVLKNANTSKIVVIFVNSNLKNFLTRKNKLKNSAQRLTLFNAIGLLSKTPQHIKTLEELFLIKENSFFFVGGVTIRNKIFINAARLKKLNYYIEWNTKKINNLFYITTRHFNFLKIFNT